MSILNQDLAGNYGLTAIADALSRDLKAELKALVMPSVEGRVDEMIEKIVADYQISVTAHQSYQSMGQEVIIRVVNETLRSPT